MTLTSRYVFSLGLVCISLALVGFSLHPAWTFLNHWLDYRTQVWHYGEPRGGGTVSDFPTPSPTPVDYKNTFELSYPGRIEAGDSVTIHYSILQKRSISTPTHPDTNQSNNFNSRVVQSGDLPVRELLGPNYEAFARSELTASGLKVESDLKPEDLQSLARSKTSWRWSVSPERVSTQTFYVTTTLIWKNRITGETRELKDRTNDAEIHVDEPALAWRQINLSSLVVGLVGSGLSMPWLFERFSRRSREKPTRQIGFVDSTRGKDKN